MKNVEVEAGDNLANLAAEFLDDSNLWREIADLNGLLPLEDLNIGSKLKIPDLTEVFTPAEKVLSEVQSTANKIENIGSKIVNFLPENSKLKGYATNALKEISKINGLANNASSILTKAKDKVRDYTGDGGIKLIDWLLK